MKNPGSSAHKHIKYRLFTLLVMIAVLAGSLGLAGCQTQNPGSKPSSASSVSPSPTASQAQNGAEVSNEQSVSDAAESYILPNEAEAAEFTEEMFEALCSENTDQSQKIAAMPKYGKNDTWAFYIYMVGSNLESCNLDELSDLSKLLIREENEAYTKERDLKKENNISNFAAEVRSGGSDLPKKLYNPVAVFEPAEGEKPDLNPDQDGSCSYNIDSMLNAQYGDNVKIVLQTGGAKRWQNVLINPNRSQRFLIDKNGFTEIYNEPLVNMGSIDTLSDFLKFCTDNYNADHKVVILWNHGSGAMGYGSDEIFEHRGLSVPDLREAFKKACGDPQDDPVFEAIGFDACLMASTEVADHLSGYAKYLYASEEIEPGTGWDYESIINALSEAPDMNGAQLGKIIADTYLYSSCSIFSGTQSFNGLTFSVTDLSKVPAVYKAYDEFAQTALKHVAEDSSGLAEISRAAAGSIAYSTGDYKYYNTFDLGLFMSGLSERYSAEAQKVIDALNEAVLYSRSSYVLEGSSGLSVYYPLYVDGTDGLNASLKYMEDVSKSKAVNALYYYKLAGCLNDANKQYLTEAGCNIPENINYAVMNSLSEIDVSFDDTGNFSLKLDPEMLAVTQDVKYSLAWYDESTGNVVYLGDDAYASLDRQGNIETFFGGKWITFGGVLLQLEVISKASENIIYSSTIDYMNKEAYLLFSYNTQTEEMTSLGMCFNEDLAVAGRNYYDLLPGTTINIVKQVGNVNSLSRSYTSDEVVIDQDTVLEDAVLGDGTYLAYITASDLRDDVYYSKVINFTMKDGVIVEQHVEYNITGYDKD
mgnify:CR=1 FL=1